MDNAGSDVVGGVLPKIHMTIQIPPSEPINMNARRQSNIAETPLPTARSRGSSMRAITRIPAGQLADSTTPRQAENQQSNTFPPPELPGFHGHTTLSDSRTSQSGSTNYHWIPMMGTRRGIRALRRSPRCKRSNGTLYSRNPFRSVHGRQRSDALPGTALARGARSRVRRP